MLAETGEDRAAYELGYLRNYSVPEGVELLPSQCNGNPIMPPTHEGHGVPLKRCDKCVCFPKRIRRWMQGDRKSPRSRLSVAIGVGNKPRPVTNVRGANGCRWNAIPLRIIPERGQRPEYVAQPSIKQLWAVLQDDEAGSYLANEPGELKPKPAPLPCETEAASGSAKILAGEAAADDIDGNSIGSKSFAGEGPDIVIARHLRPMLRQHAPAEGFDLAEGDRLEAARPLQPQAEAADAREQVEHLELTPAHLISPLCHAEWFASAIASGDRSASSGLPR